MIQKIVAQDEQLIRIFVLTKSNADTFLESDSIFLELRFFISLMTFDHSTAVKVSHESRGQRPKLGHKFFEVLTRLPF